MSTPPGYDGISASVILNVLGLRDRAVYGFRSWMLQDIDEPYEVILNLFGDRDIFDPLLAGKNEKCIVRILQHPKPNYFNTSAANNYGLYSSRGQYVVFANADIVYPGNFLRRAVGEMRRRDICYAVAARTNLLREHVAALKPATEYTGTHAFDDLYKFDRAPGVTTWPAISPWMLRRDIAFAVGGFDPEVILAEDWDLESRVTHYLRRMGLQQVHHSFCDLRGYHLDHPNTGLIDTFAKSKSIIEPRVARLRADPSSTEDVVPTKLNDESALRAQMLDTDKPPAFMRHRHNLPKRIVQRAKDVWKTFLHGR